MPIGVDISLNSCYKLITWGMGRGKQGLTRPVKTSHLQPMGAVGVGAQDSVSRVMAIRRSGT